jgi:hypothetical protein
METPLSDHKRFYNRAAREKDIFEWMMQWPEEEFEDRLIFFRVCVEDLPIDALGNTHLPASIGMGMVYDLWQLNDIRQEREQPLIAAKSWKSKYPKLNLW